MNIVVAVKKRKLVSTFVLTFFLGWALLNQGFFSNSNELKESKLTTVEEGDQADGSVLNENPSDAKVNNGQEKPVPKISKSRDRSDDELLEYLDEEFISTVKQKNDLLKRAIKRNKKEHSAKRELQQRLRQPSSKLSMLNNELVYESDLWSKSDLE